MYHLKKRSVSKPIFTLSTLTVSCLLAFNAQATIDCSSIEEWNSSSSYSGGSQVQENNIAYKANWWTQGLAPSTHSNDFQEWSLLDSCETGENIGNEVPTVSLSSPSASDNITENDTVSITANAADTDGSVVRVDFYTNGALIGSASSSPFALTWTAIQGQHSLTAKAIDNKGAETTSSAVIITVATAQGGNELPTVDLTLSTNSVDVGATVTLASVAADSDGTVDKVDFFANGTLIGTAATSPYTLAYTATQPGNINFFARATDDLGATSDSAISQLSVSGGSVSGNCRPDGLYQTEGVTVPYCSIYDEDGREIMGADHPRRVIGYFTSWRAGDDAQTSYLVKDIPWEQLTHINYAFVSIGADGNVNIGDVNDPTNPVVGMEWDSVEIDPTLGFKGHFGALATAKAKYDVKTLISIGGWAETGGHFGTNGDRVADGGFYTMTTNADGSINHAGIEKFATSAVEMIRKYKFDGVDVDYEYPTSMSGAGNPDDQIFAEARRPYLMRSYHELMRVLREKLDKASADDGTHYMLTIAAPSSGYLLRGMETMEITKYLDYVNIMS